MRILFLLTCSVICINRRKIYQNQLASEHRPYAVRVEKRGHVTAISSVIEKEDHVLFRKHGVIGGDI